MLHLQESHQCGKGATSLPKAALGGATLVPLWTAVALGRCHSLSLLKGREKYGQGGGKLLRVALGRNPGPTKRHSPQKGNIWVAINMTLS